MLDHPVKPGNDNGKAARVNSPRKSKRAAEMAARQQY
jgi:hypothetical protein